SCSRSCCHRLAGFPSRLSLSSSNRNHPIYSITTNQAAIAALFRVVNRYVGNLAPMPGVFPDYPAPVVRNTDNGRELSMMRWGMPPPPPRRAAGYQHATRRHRTGAAGSSRRIAAWQPH
ncbi:putative SOS response-associated peptidase YedK, partial [Bradyrhizobium sp. S3.9.2]